MRALNSGKILTVGLALLAGALIGCSSPRGDLFSAPKQPLVWPQAPDQARVKYVGSLSMENDLKPEVSWTEGLTQLIFGKKKVGVLIGPYAVAVDPNDKIYVTDVPASVVHMFDLKARRYCQFSDLDQDEKLLGPVGLALIGGRVYVVDSVLAKVCIFNAEGTYLSSFGQGRLKRPSGIAYRPGRQWIYVTDTARHVINVFDMKGRFVKEIGERGYAPGTFNFPTHLCVDDAGRLYVSDTLNYRVQVFDSDGTFIRTFGAQGDRPGNFAHPAGIAVDNHGRIYVIDRQYENVQIFDGDGQMLMAFGEEGAGFGQFWLPGGIFLDERNRIYVADSFNKRIQVFELLEELQK